MCPRRGKCYRKWTSRGPTAAVGEGCPPPPPPRDGGVRLDVPGQWRGPLPSAVRARHGAAKQGPSGGFVGTTSRGTGRGCVWGDVRVGQAVGGGARGGERPMGPEGKGSRVSGEGPTGAARCRQHYNRAPCHTPPRGHGDGGGRRVGGGRGRIREQTVAGGQFGRLRSRPATQPSEGRVPERLRTGRAVGGWAHRSPDGAFAGPKGGKQTVLRTGVVHNAGHSEGSTLDLRWAEGS